MSVSIRAALLGALMTSAIAMPTAAAAQATKLGAPTIPFTERKLANGLRVIAIRDTSTPDVTVSMWYEVGSKHDPEGRSGFAHLFEHILSRKTVNMPYNTINKMVDDIGGTRNASTWYDRTNYYETVPAQYLERMLWTHAERMARPVIDKEVFETERNVVKEELRQRVLAPPYGRLYSFALGENVYNVLPHRRPTIGSISDLDSATLEDARAFHEAFYGPDTATLIVSGNFEPSQLDALVNKYFAAVPKRPRPASLAIKGKDRPLNGRRVSATGPNVPLPIVGAAWQTPGAASTDMAAMEVLDAILTRGDSNRLETALVKTGLSTRPISQLNDTEEQGYYALMAIVASGREPEVVATELARTLDALRKSGPTAAELAEAKNELLSAGLEEREVASSRAFTLGEGLVRTGDPRAADKRLAAVTRVTAADVQRVARTILDPAKRIELRYAKGDGEAKGWANPTPLPRFASPPPAARPPLALLPEGQRQAPPAPGTPAQFRMPALSETTLGNGMKLVTARTGNVPLATLTVAIRAGSAVEPRAKAGLASMVANIASKGTTTRSADQIAAGLERLGADLSANASLDGTVLSLTAPVATMPQAAEILGDILANSTFPEEDFAREKKRSLDGLQVALKDPGQIAGLALPPVVFGSAPYGTVASPATIAGLTRADLAQFRSTWWRPDLATAFVSGGIDPAQARQIAEKALGGWRATGAAPALPSDVAGSEQAPRTLVIDLPGAGQATVVAAVRGVPRSDAGYYDALLANSILGGSSTGRLFQEIRVKRALSYGASSSLAAGLGSGTLSASASTKNESAAEVAQVFLDQFSRIGSEPLTAADVENRKTFMVGSFQRSLQSSAGFNSQLAGASLRGVSPTEQLAYAERVRAVGGTAATSAIGRLLQPSRVSLVIVGDSAKFIDKVRAMRPDVMVVPADQLDLSTLGIAR
ncbi:pitrilysin family protein [Sphingomonas swuensis]|uniref:Pitrilysin family protein n=1 Tax=Sphingomonas swuensis TaxID=977800 RepID=A0ABP7T8Y5_9SPHN